MSFQAEIQIKKWKIKIKCIDKKKQQLKSVEIVTISAPHLVPTIHILVFIISKYLQCVQFDENEYNLCS